MFPTDKPNTVNALEGYSHVVYLSAGTHGGWWERSFNVARARMLKAGLAYLIGSGSELPRQAPASYGRSPCPRVPLLELFILQIITLPVSVQLPKFGSSDTTNSL